jgi:DNA polymerase-3 subunit gamma/tau
MLGLSGRAAIFGLIENIFEGDAPAALSALNALHDKGGDPLMILTDAADAVHALSRLKAVPAVYPPDFSAGDKVRADKLSGAIAVPRLAIAWQMLLKGLDEAARAPRPFAAAEMLLIRMCYTAQLPSPADIIGSLAGKTRPQEAPGGEPPRTAREAAMAAPAPLAQEAAPSGEKPRPQAFGSFEDVVAYAGQARDIKLKIALEEQASLVKFGHGFIELHLLDGAPQNLAQDLSRKMQSWTGERWIVSLSEERGLEPLGARRRAEEAQAVEDIRKHPVVKSVMHHFPDAEIKSVRALD